MTSEVTKIVRSPRDRAYSYTYGRARPQQWNAAVRFLRDYVGPIRRALHRGKEELS